MLLAGSGAAGFVIWMPDPAYRADAATLVTIQVRPECRRRGYGRTLLGVFAEQGAESGYRLLHLGVHKDNPARALYEQAGWQLAGTQPATWVDPDGSTPTICCYVAPHPHPRKKAGRALSTD